MFHKISKAFSPLMTPSSLSNDMMDSFDVYTPTLIESSLTTKRKESNLESPSSNGILPSPPLSSEDSRISKLMSYAGSSKSVKHPYLDSLKSQSLPNMEMALQDFVAQIRAIFRSQEYLLQAILERLLDNPSTALIQDLLERESGNTLTKGVKLLTLYERFEKALQIPAPHDYCASVLKWESKLLQMCRKSGIHGIGAVVIGLEWTLKQVFSLIYETMQSIFPDLPSTDSLFFSVYLQSNPTLELQIHSLALQYVTDKSDYQALEEGLHSALKCQTLFWDELYTRALKMKASHFKKQVLPTSQEASMDWYESLRRRQLMQVCDTVQSLRVLEIGCGTGWLCRALVQKGAISVTGVDCSSVMIEKASKKETIGSKNIRYAHCHSRNLIGSLKSSGLPLQYDLIVSMNVFQDMTLEEMGKAMAQVRALLAPKGRFIFSTSHPCLPFWKKEGKHRFPICFDSNRRDYFKDRNHSLQGKLALPDGSESSFSLYHKTMEDFVSALKYSGLSDALKVREFVADESLKGLKGTPLHMVFTASPPDMTRTLINVSSTVWKSMPEIFEVRVPTALVDAFDKIHKNATDLGHTAETLQVYSEEGELLAGEPGMTLKSQSSAGCDLFDVKGQLILPSSLQKEFKLLAVQISAMLFARESHPNAPGFALVTGLDLGSYKGHHRELLCQLFFRIINWHLGFLLDTETQPTDIEKAEPQWRSESLDRFAIPDTVGFICTKKETHFREGNDLVLANAANAYHDLFDTIPISVLRHLQAPFFRGTSSPTHETEESTPTLDIVQNIYPIFQHSTGGLPFLCRYSRSEVERGYQKHNLGLPERLSWGMDALEDCLDNGIQVGITFKPGQMLFVNNCSILCKRIKGAESRTQIVKARLQSSQM